jgi:hypothetical protein
MKLQDEKIVFIRNTGTSWSNFEKSDAVISLPKYDAFIMIPTGKIGSQIDYRVIPSMRKRENEKAAARWATHYAILSQFLDSDKKYLFVCEDDLELKSNHIILIENFNSGILLLADTDMPAQAYIIDKPTAKTIITQSYIFYTNWDTMLIDMKNLNLIELTIQPVIKRSWDYTLFFEICFILLLLAASICMFFMLCPLNSFRSKNSISLTEVLTTEEPIVCTEWAWVSSHQNTVIDVD